MSVLSHNTRWCSDDMQHVERDVPDAGETPVASTNGELKKRSEGVKMVVSPGL